MTPRRLALGTAFRLAVATLFSGLATLAAFVSLPPSVLQPLLGGNLALGLVTVLLIFCASPAIAFLILRPHFRRADRQKRFAIASVLANGSNAALMGMCLVIFRNNEGMAWLMGFNTLAYSLMTFLRAKQLSSGGYLKRFEAKGSRPSLCELIRSVQDEARSRASK